MMRCALSPTVTELRIAKFHIHGLILFVAQLWWAAILKGQKRNGRVLSHGMPATTQDGLPHQR